MAATAQDSRWRLVCETPCSALCSELSPLRQQFTLIQVLCGCVLLLWLIYAGVQRRPQEEAAGGSRRRCTPRRPGCCDAACNPAGPRATIHRNDLASCSGAQARWPLRGRAQASYAAAGQPQGSSGGHSSGGLRGSPKPRPMMVITIVGHVATVSPGVKINGSASLCVRPGA